MSDYYNDGYEVGRRKSHVEYPVSDYDKESFSEGIKYGQFRKKLSDEIDEKEDS